MTHSTGNRLGRWTGVAASVAGTAALGSLASGHGANSRWYHRLDKPPFQPPALAFPVVWTLLYADIAATAGLTLDELQPQQRSAHVRTLAVDRRAGRALVPYPLWCGFATVLSAAIWRRNR